MLELWPFTNFHDLNLDWIIQTLKKWDARLRELFEGNGLLDYVEEVLKRHPEWVTTVMDKAITMRKFADDVLAEFDKNQALAINGPLAYVGAIEHSTFTGGATVSLQGGCYNPDMDQYAFFMAPTSGTTGKIVQTSKDLTILATNTGNIGHANDATFYSGMYYVARAENAGEVTLVNATTLQIGQTFVVPDVAGAVQNISYDEENDLFWLMDDNNTLYKVSTDLAEAETVTTLNNADLFENAYTNVTGLFLAGSAAVKGVYTLIGYIARWDHDLPIIRMITIDRDGTILKLEDTYCITIYDEAEALIYNGETLEVFGKAGGYITKYTGGAGTGAYTGLDFLEYDRTDDNNADELENGLPTRAMRNTFYHMKHAHPLLKSNDGVVQTVKLPDGVAQLYISRGGLFFRKKIGSTWYDWHGPLGIVSERTTVYPEALAAGAQADYTHTWNTAQQDREYTTIVTPIYCENIAMNVKSFNESSVTVTMTNNSASSQVPSFQIAAIRKGN